MNARKSKGLSFARRMYAPRVIGTALGFVCVLIGLWPLQPEGWVWGLLVAHGFVWPHLAYQLARLSNNAYHTEQRSLVFDGFAGGCWAGVMGLNPLPSAIILSMIAMDKIAAGGWRMLGKTLVVQVLGIALGFWLYAPPLFPPTTQNQLLACLPILLVYPMFIGFICYKVTVQLSEHKRALARLSQTDSLTGLINHGAWKDLLTREFERCRGDSQPNALALIDIDHFKQINDRHGHLMGDNILRTLSAFLAGHLRKSDTVARYGGDEFCVMLAGTTAEQAAEVLERLREAVDMYRYPGLPEQRLSLSIGIAPFESRLESADAWWHEADMALYRAKSAGRNRVVVGEGADSSEQLPM